VALQRLILSPDAPEKWEYSVLKAVLDTAFATA